MRRNKLILSMFKKTMLLLSGSCVHLEICYIHSVFFSFACTNKQNWKSLSSYCKPSYVGMTNLLLLCVRINTNNVVLPLTNKKRPWLVYVGPASVGARSSRFSQLTILAGRVQSRLRGDCEGLDDGASTRMMGRDAASSAAVHGNRDRKQFSSACACACLCRISCSVRGTWYYTHVPTCRRCVRRQAVIGIAFAQPFR